MTLRLMANCVTVEHDASRAGNHIVINPFPNADPDAGFALVGTVSDLRGVVDSMSRLLDDLEEDGVE